MTPAGAEVTAVALEGEVRERPVPSGWYAALGVAWAGFVATALLLPAFLVSAATAATECHRAS